MASGRTDLAWKHCVSVDGKTRNLRCKYCDKVLTGGVYRLKHHLAGTSKDVGACVSVPEDVKKSMMDIVVNLQQIFLKKSISREESSVGQTESGIKRSIEEEIGNSSNISREKDLKVLLMPFSRRMTEKMHVKRLLGFSTIMLSLLM